MDLDQILPRLWVGACPRGADDVDRLQRQFGVTAVLNVQAEEDFAYWGIDWPALEAHYRRRGIEVRRVAVRDFDPDHLRRCLPDCVYALDEMLRAGHTVLVHCSAGVNRSPGAVIAYLHWVLGWELDRALHHVADRRECDPYLEAIQSATADWQKQWAGKKGTGPIGRNRPEDEKGSP
jgi:hypothetical protein